MPMPEHSNANPFSSLDETSKIQKVPPCRYLGTETDPQACTYGKPGEEPKPSKASDGLVSPSFRPTKIDLPMKFAETLQQPKLRPSIPRRSCIWAVIPLIQAKCDKYEPK